MDSAPYYRTPHTNIPARNPGMVGATVISDTLSVSVRYVSTPLRPGWLSHFKVFLVHETYTSSARPRCHSQGLTKFRSDGSPSPAEVPQLVPVVEPRRPRSAEHPGVRRKRASSPPLPPRSQQHQQNNNRDAGPGLPSSRAF